MRLADCHPQRKHKARGLCGACYDRALRDENPAYQARQTANVAKWAAQSPDKHKDNQRSQTRRRSKDPVYKRWVADRALLRHFGLPMGAYDTLLAAQGGGCKLCYRKPGTRRLHVDHDHETGAVRGLLCHQCNWYVGTIDADPTIIDRLRRYLNV